jgi:transposase InsO family protein
LTTKGPAEVAEALMKIIRQFGPMKILHTDNGKEFKNKLMVKITEYAKVEHRFGSSYHPRAQGAVERENVSIFGNKVGKCHTV